MTAWTAPELSDAWIERMLAERAGERAPVGLDADIAAAVKATPRHRPMFGGALGWRPATARGRALAFAAITGLVAVALVGAAIGAGAIRTSRTSPSVLPTRDPSATVAPSEDPRPAPPGVAVDFSHERSLVPHRVSDTVGWMATPTSLYRSTDGGLTWVDTRVPLPGLDGVPATIDEETAYAVSHDASSVSIAATHDGGATWATARLGLDPGWVMPMLDLRSATAGTLTLFGDGATIKAGSLLVWSTRDGGATWAGPVRGVVPDQTGKVTTAMGGLMWLSVGRPFDGILWLSRDGGATWIKGRFPASKATGPDAFQWVVSAPVVGDDGRLVLAIDQGGTVGIFSSIDDGQAWQFLGTTPGGYSLGPPRSDAVWVFGDRSGQAFTSTTDGGSHWRTIKGASRILSLFASFSSPTTGWAVHACDRGPYLSPKGPDPLCDGNTLASIFLATSDGGRTWHPPGS